MGTPSCSKTSVCPAAFARHDCPKQEQRTVDPLLILLHRQHLGKMEISAIPRLPTAIATRSFYGFETVNNISLKLFTHLL
jgi:hypothetical protein